jgi:hypothetical protein
MSGRLCQDGRDNPRLVLRGDLSMASVAIWQIYDANNKQGKDVHRHEPRRADGVTFGGTEAANVALQNASTIIVRCCGQQIYQSDNLRTSIVRDVAVFEMICLHNVCDVARAMRDNVDTGPASQAVIEQSCAPDARTSSPSFCEAS